MNILIDFFQIADPTSTLQRPYIDPIKTIKMRRKRKKTIKMRRWRRENNKSEEVEVEEGK